MRNPRKLNFKLYFPVPPTYLSNILKKLLIHSRFQLYNFVKPDTEKFETVRIIDQGSLINDQRSSHRYAYAAHNL